MTVKVIKEKCISCGLCASMLPEVFELPDNDVAYVKEQPTSENEDKAREAAHSCPTEAIDVE